MSFRKNVWSGNGNLCADPEVRDVGESKVAKFCVAATGREYKKGDEWVREPMFMNCEVWGNQIQYIEEFKKGDEIIVEGPLLQDEWEDKTTGEKRRGYKVRVDFFRPISKRNVEAKSQAQQEAPKQPAATGKRSYTKKATSQDDNVPF